MDKFGKITSSDNLVSSKTIPVPSEFALQLLSLSSSNLVNRERFTEVVCSNKQFSGQLQKYVNSSFSQSKKTVTTVEQAIESLGYNPVANLALIFSLLSQFKHGKCANFDYQRFWQTSVAQGIASRSLASFPSSKPNDLFTYAMLGNIGELALATTYPNRYGQLLGQKLSPSQVADKEKQLFGLSSQELTWMLLASWQIPQRWTDIIRHYNNHCNENTAETDTNQICNQMELGHLIAKICLLEPPLSERFLNVEKKAEELGIAVDQFGPFFDQIAEELYEASVFFELPSINCPKYHQIKVLDDETSHLAQSQDEPITILAVDDDPMTIIYLKKVLESETRNLITAEDGEAALALALEHRPKLVITDWRMPKLNGIDLCKILRKTKVTQHTYIIMLTGNETEDELVTAFDAGADDYILKPFTPKVLQARIRSGERLIRYQQTIHKDREVIQTYATNLAEANRELQNMAMTDFLTGLPNRRSALVRLKNLVAEVQRYGEPLSCLMVDIDHFKKVNDTYGHDCGDEVLKKISSLLEDKARSYDMVSRWGGEEFLIISARSSHKDTIQLAQRLRQTVEQTELKLSGGIVLQLTISIGVATWKTSFTDEDELLKEADTQLYNAKTRGRNRVEPTPTKSF